MQAQVQGDFVVLKLLKYAYALPCAGEGGLKGALLVHGGRHEAEGHTAIRQDGEGTADSAAPPGSSA